HRRVRRGVGAPLRGPLVRQGPRAGPLLRPRGAARPEAHRGLLGLPGGLAAHGHHPGGALQLRVVLAHEELGGGGLDALGPVVGHSPAARRGAPVPAGRDDELL
ncbi:unnamed protein product, partial [Prorocentrum cordatum]